MTENPNWMKDKNQKRYIFVLNVSEEKKEAKPKNVNHIAIYDRSGSMYGSLPRLVDELKLGIKDMDKDDRYSILWFSSNGEYRTLFKGVKNNDDTVRDENFKILDTTKQTVGCTCFSEVMLEAEKIIDEFEPLNMNTCITFFTDGEPCCRDSYDEDRKVTEIITRIKDKIVAFNTIGYNNYCDEDMLQRWSNLTEFGTFTHSDNIKDYSNIFKTNTANAKNLSKTPIQVSSNSKVYYFTENNFTVANMIDNQHMSSKKNQFVILSDEDHIEATVNGQKMFINARNCTDDNNDVIMKTLRFSDGWIESIVYKMAMAEYTHGDVHESLVILANMAKDKVLTDKQLSSFTFSEKEDFRKNLKKACINATYRASGTVPIGYLPDENTPCIFDLINMLSESPNNKIIFNPEGYNRIGKPTSYQRFTFKKDSDTIISPINAIVFDKEKLNMSISVNQSGCAYFINDAEREQAELLGLGEEDLKCKIFRTYNIIKDGNYNMDKLTVKLIPKTFSEVMGTDKFVSAISESKIQKGEITFDLTKIPVINAKYAKTSVEELFDLVCRENMLMAQLKLCKKLTVAEAAENTWEAKNYFPEQAAFLENMGIKNKIYNGIGASVPSNDESDFYTAKSYATSLKGFSAISPITLNESNEPTIPVDKTKSARVEKAKAKGEACDETDIYKNGDVYLAKAIETYKDFNSLTKKEALTKEYAEVRSKIAAIKLAKTLTGYSFDPEKIEVDEKNKNVIHYTGVDKYSGKTLTMNIKTEKKQIAF